MYVMAIMFVFVFVPLFGAALWFVASAFLAFILGILAESRIIRADAIIFAIRKGLIISTILALAWRLLIRIMRPLPYVTYQDVSAAAHAGALVACVFAVIIAIKNRPTNFNNFKARLGVGMLVVSIIFLVITNMLHG